MGGIVNSLGSNYKVCLVIQIGLAGAEETSAHSGSISYMFISPAPSPVPQGNPSIPGFDFPVRPMIHFLCGWGEARDGGVGRLWGIPAQTCALPPLLTQHHVSEHLPAQ